VRFGTESCDVAQALVGAGSGVALVSCLAPTDTPGTTHRELVRPRPYREIHAVAQAGTTLTPLVEVFLGLLRDGARERAATWRESAASD
jgi:DNA-binding transcriptional LysR family regulator